MAKKRRSLKEWFQNFKEDNVFKDVYQNRKNLKLNKNILNSRNILALVLLIIVLIVSGWWVFR